jgi:hypothetical protein
MPKGMSKATLGVWFENLEKEKVTALEKAKIRKERFEDLYGQADEHALTALECHEQAGDQSQDSSKATFLQEANYHATMAVFYQGKAERTYLI